MRMREVMEIDLDVAAARSVRDLPIPPRELAIIKAMRTARLRERMAVGRPMTDGDLILARIDGSPLPVRDYTRLFADRRKAAGLPSITLRNLRHSSVSRMRGGGCSCRCRRRLARPQRADDDGGLRARERRSAQGRCRGVFQGRRQ